MHRAGALALLLLVAALAPRAQAAHDAEPLTLASIDGAGTYQVGWRLVETEHRFSGRLDEGASRNLKLVVEQENATDVSFVVEWSEDEESVDVSREDLFELAVESPDGVPFPTERGREGRLGVASGALNAVPSSVTIDVASADEAYERLDAFRGEAGLGEWRISIRLVDAGNPKGVAADAGNSYEVTVIVRHYEALLLRVVSLGPPPPLTIAEAAKSTPRAWLWSTIGLACASIALGGFLARDAWRKRRS